MSYSGRVRDVVLVDADDHAIGQLEAVSAHTGQGALHRAFMVMIGRADGRLLLCRRSPEKPLWPGVWADSCASHPAPGEDIVRAAEQRIREEIGITTPLVVVGRFVYRAVDEDRGIEHESCWVLEGRWESGVHPDPREVSEYTWAAFDELRAMCRVSGNAAPWLEHWIELVASGELNRLPE